MISFGGLLEECLPCFCFDFVLVFCLDFFIQGFFPVVLTPSGSMIPISVSEIQCTRGFCDEQQQQDEELGILVVGC